MTWSFFFKLTTNRVSADLEHTSRIPHPRPVNGHLYQLKLNGRITSFVGVNSHERALTISTAIALGTPTCLSKTLNPLSQATMLASNCF